MQGDVGDGRLGETEVESTTKDDDRERGVDVKNYLGHGLVGNRGYEHVSEHGQWRPT